MEEVVIVGAGIGGLATAIALKRVGVRALVLERSEELRPTGAAITLAPNAWIALDALGVSHKLASRYRPIEGATVTDVMTGATQHVPFGVNNSTEGHKIRSVHRKVLLQTLAEELPPESIRFSSKLKTIETLVEQGSPVFVLRLEDGSIIKAKVAIGCDGVHSVIARKLGLRPAASSGRSAVRGLAVFPDPHGINNSVHEFVCPSKRLLWVTLNDKEVYWGLTYKTPPNGENMSKDPDQIKKEVIENLSKDLPPTFLDIVDHSDPSTLSWAPLMFRYPWNLIFGKLSEGNMTVAGDAMHPTTPDLGQGGCLALEDAVVLGRHIGNSIKDNGNIDSKNVGRAIEKYVAERRWRAATIITASFLSGWVQQDGSNWVMKFLRDSVFYKLLLSRMHGVIHYDCGKLPVKME